MGKLIMLAVLAIAGFSAYWFGFHKSPAYLAYLKWAQATRNGDCKTLQAMADGDAKKWVDGFCTPQGGMTVMGQAVPGMVAANMVSDLRNTPQGSMMRFGHELESEEEAADGTIQLKAVESVLNHPTAHFKPAPPSRQTLKLKQVGDDFKVLEYKDEPITEMK